MTKEKLYFTAKLGQWRTMKGYTQMEMRSLLGIEWDTYIPLSTYQKWEQGVNNIDTDRALMMARFTELPLEELVCKK